MKDRFLLNANGILLEPCFRKSLVVLLGAYSRFGMYLQIMFQPLLRLAIPMVSICHVMDLCGERLVIVSTFDGENGVR